MDTYLMTDQPPTCPKCGRRVEIIEGHETDRQLVECKPCDYRYQLEAEAPEPVRKLSFRREKDDVGGGYGRSDY